MSATNPKCGTYAGYREHKRFGTETCDACRAAWTAYVREQRATKPEHRAKGKAQRQAWQAADALLRAAHVDEWERYYAIERALRGLRAVPQASGNRVGPLNNLSPAKDLAGG